MKTFALIEIDADGGKCGERCPHRNISHCNAILGDLNYDCDIDAYLRSPACLAAEAKAKGKLDDPVVAEAMKLAKDVIEIDEMTGTVPWESCDDPQCGCEDGLRDWFKELEIPSCITKLAKALLRLAGEGE